MLNNPFFIPKRLRNPFFLSGLILLFITSCNPTKYVGPEELFLQKNKVKIDTRKLEKDDLKAIVKQKTNKKILGLLRFHLWENNRYKKDNESKIKLNVGELPVIYDSLLTDKTVKQLKLYTDKRGYFDSKVCYTSKIHKNKIRIEY